MQTEKNKEVVVRFNKEYIEQGNVAIFKDLVSEELVNHSAPKGANNGPESMVNFLQNVLRKGFPDITVQILDQIAEGDKVTTRKTFTATHTGPFMGIDPTNKKVVIKVIDIIRLKDGKYVEHWGMSNLAEILTDLSAT